jgi:hypothetical protein
MSEGSERDPIAVATARGHFIIVAFLAGQVALLAIVLVARAGGATAPRPGGPNTPVLTYAAIAFAVALVPLSIFLPDRVIAGARQKLAPKLRGSKDRVEALVPLFLPWLIAGAALREGAAFLALIAYLIEGSPVALFLGLLLIVSVAFRFPTRVAFDHWLADQERRLEEIS